MHGNELNQDLIRILIGQKKHYVQIVEVTKTYETIGFLSSSVDDRAVDALR